jgi:hypothetical protein
MPDYSEDSHASYNDMAIMLLSRKKEGSGGSYTSGAKLTRERCIRVAAIVIMITPGASNICDVKKN